MGGAEVLVEVMRGGRVESVHRGHAVVVDAAGAVLEAWGDAGAVIYPRSSCKMLQALPLMESGAGAGLDDVQLALACASHQGAAIHTGRVARWLKDLGLGDDDLRCGPAMPADREAAEALICTHTSPCQTHNECSGKHAGFLTLARHLRAGPEYVEIDHPVQRAVRAAIEEMCGETSPGHGIDGCSAPNFAVSLTGLGRAMAKMAAAREDSGDARARGAARLVAAMRKHPEMVAGEGRSCTELMRAMGGRVAIKTGAEAVFVAILPEQRLGVALKIADGGMRAAECAIVAILCRLGVLEPDHPTTRRWMNTAMLNRRGIEVGSVRPAAALAPGQAGGM